MRLADYIDFVEGRGGRYWMVLRKEEVDREIGAQKQVFEMSDQ